MASDDAGSYPDDREIEALLATHLLGWTETRLHPASGTYVGKRPGASAATPVPLYLLEPDSANTIVELLVERGYSFRIERQPNPLAPVRVVLWGTQEHVAEGRTLIQAFGRAAWRAIVGSDPGASTPD